MNIQKTTGNINSKPAAQNPTQTAKSAAGAVSKTPQTPASRSVSSLISAAGLPADRLSASIISFARFFSLPLKPELLKNIRQQAFEANAPLPEPVPSAEEGGPKPGIVFKNREALSLAAASAEGKGLELQPKGLEAYAQAVDPDWRRQDGGHGEQRGKRKREDSEKGEDPLQKTAALSAAGVEKIALEGAGKDALLAILNMLPGKDGKRWVVLPFDFSENGREFKVSLRILLDAGKNINRADCMALDIAVRDIDENGKTEKRRLFVLEPANRLSVYLQPEISKKERTELIRELSALPGITPERIFIKEKTEEFPFEAGFGNDLLRSIDEAV
jgi:hypothetical protein